MVAGVKFLTSDHLRAEVKEDYPPRVLGVDDRCESTHDGSSEHRSQCSRPLGHEGKHVGYRYPAGKPSYPVAAWVN